MKDKARPQDYFMFIKDVEKYLEKATVHALTSYLVMTKKSILSSVKKWKRYQEAGVVSVIKWLQNVPGKKAFIKQAEKKARKHWEDGRKKERRRQKEDVVGQQSIAGYLSLFG